MPRYRFAVLAIGTIAHASFMASVIGLAVIAPALRERYALSLSELAVVLAAMGLGQTVTLLPWGLITDRAGERLVVGVGLGSAASALAAAAFVSQFWTLCALVFIAGGAGAGTSAATGRAVMGWFPPAQRGLALGVRQTAIPIGGGIAALLMPPVLNAGGLRWAFLTLAFGCGVSAALGWAGLRDAPASEKHDAEAILNPLRDRRIWRLSTASAFLLCPQTTILSFVVIFLHDARGFTTAQAGAALAAIQAVGFVGRIASGRWSDRLGLRILPMLQIALATVVMLGAAAALIHAPGWLLVPTLVIAGGLAMSWNGLSFTATAELAGRARVGAALGFQQTILAIVSSVVPLAFAPLVDATSWQVGFAFAALTPLAGAVLLHSLRRY